MARRNVPFWVWRLFAAVLGGLIAGPTLPRANLWLLIFPSVALLMWSSKRLKAISGYFVGVAGGIAFYASQSPWLTAYLGPVPWLALATLQGLLFGLGALVSTMVWRWRESTEMKHSWREVLTALALASTWTAREFLSGHWPYGGYQWSRLIQTQADTFLSNWVYWLGLSGGSLVVALLAALLLLVALNHGRIGTPAAVAALVLLTVGALTVVPSQLGGKTLTVAAVQGNANAGLFANPVPGSILKKHLAATERLAIDPEFSEVRLVVWPENASDLDPLGDPRAIGALKQVTDETLKTDLVVGGVTYRGDRVYNSTVLYQPSKGATDWYDKLRPVPFAEYIPNREFWYPLAPDLIGLITHGFDFGERDGIFETSGVKVGSLICFEITIDDVVSKLVDEGAQIILSQANNSDFGHTDETFQQETLARLQAIATGRSVVHVSTVGVTELILPNGKVTEKLTPFTSGYLIGELPLSTQITPAMRIGVWFDVLNALGIAVFLAWQVRRRLGLMVQRFAKKVP